MANAEQKIPVIRGQTLEHIARHFGELITGWKIELLLKDWGVPETLINHSGSKWWTVNEVLKHYAYSTEKKDHEMLFKIIGEILHPIMYNGNKEAAKTAAEDFNKYLEYDNHTVWYSDEDKKYIITRKMKPEEEEEEISGDLFVQEQEELEFLRQLENKEKISTLRKAYQVFTNIVEVFCDNPSKPSRELNDAYVKTKKLITDAVRDLRIYSGVEKGARRIELEHYCIPFNNLFTAEAEYKDRTPEKLHWDEIRPKMNATYGCIDELYRVVDGSDVLSQPDVQQTLNDVSLLLSKTKEENKKIILSQTTTEEQGGAEEKGQSKSQKIIDALDDTIIRGLKNMSFVSQNHQVVQKIEITAMPELQVRNMEDNTLAKGKKRIHLPKFNSTDWSNITIRFLDEQNVFITADKKQIPSDYEALGFADEKRDKPNMAWAFFRGLAQNKGETGQLPIPIPDTIKQQKRQLSDRLKTIFKNDTDPFYDPTETRIYKIKINLIPPQSESEGTDKLGVQEYLKETMTEKYEKERKEDE